MKRALTTIAAAGALAAATVAVPTQANAFAQWIVPAIVVAGVGGLALGATAANANAAYYNGAYAPAGSVYVQPRAAARTCQIVRERTASGGVRRVEVCN
jgi:hypothetical protein